jgi:exonuclease III
MTTPETHLRIWQQNVHKSKTAQLHVLETLEPDDWDIVLLQEPYIDKIGNSRANFHWRVVLPSAHLTNTKTIRSIILVNRSLLTNTWSEIPIPSPTSDLTAVQISGDFGRFTIINIYNDNTHSKSFDALRDFLDNNRSSFCSRDNDYFIIAGDLNRHHPLWEDHTVNPQLTTAAYTARAQPIIDMMNDFEMDMALRPAVPTLERGDGGCSRPDNVFVSGNLMDSVLECDVDPSN